MIFDRQALPALIVATATLGASGIGFFYAVHALNYYLEKEAVPLRAALTTIPKRLGAWEAEGPDERLTAETEQELGTEHYIARWYVKDGAGPATGPINVHITYYTGLIDTVPHIPDRCLVAGGAAQQGRPVNLDLAVDGTTWQRDPIHVNRRMKEPYWVYTYRHRITGQAVTVRMPFGDFRLRTTEYRFKEKPGVRVHAGYFFIANGETTPMPALVRSFAFDLTTRHAYYAKVQFTMYTTPEVAPEQFVATASDLLVELLPELMRCLPDWAEVESRAVAGIEETSS